MANLFSGLEAFGLGKMSNIEVYSSEEKASDKQGKEVEKVVISESDFLFDKSYNCPVCDKEFKSKTVKTGRVKLMSADSDLRPKYQNVDSLKYDAIVCPHCGYAALNRFFNYVTSVQCRFIREQISSSFRGLKEDGDTYTYDDAIGRHKLALVSTIVKKGKLSERAYTCLKTAWMLRGKSESIIEEKKNAGTALADSDKAAIAALQKEEHDFIIKAYEGFIEAFSKELFPMCGMDENTMTYLVADLANRIGKHDEASRWISKVLVSRDANERLKAKARELKESLKSS